MHMLLGSLQHVVCNSCSRCFIWPLLQLWQCLLGCHQQNGVLQQPVDQPVLRNASHKQQVHCATPRCLLTWHCHSIQTLQMGLKSTTRSSYRLLLQHFSHIWVAKAVQCLL
jgi:hypothetical protein